MGGGAAAPSSRIKEGATAPYTPNLEGGAGAPHNAAEASHLADDAGATPPITGDLPPEFIPQIPRQASSSTRGRRATDGSVVNDVILDPSTESGGEADNERGDGDYADDQVAVVPEYRFLTTAEQHQVTAGLGATAKSASAPVLPSRRYRFPSSGPSSAATPRPSKGSRSLSFTDWVTVKDEIKNEPAQDS